MAMAASSDLSSPSSSGKGTKSQASSFFASFSVSSLKSPSSVSSIMMGSEEEFCFTSTSSPEDAFFDQVIGELEDLLMDPSFTTLQHGFFDQHIYHFDNADSDVEGENKFEYTQIFAEYTRMLELFLETRLATRVANFSMAQFMTLLKTRPELCQEGDVFDLLSSLGDFQSFKETILDYKKDKEGTNFSLDGLLSVSRA